MFWGKYLVSLILYICRYAVASGFIAHSDFEKKKSTRKPCTALSISTRNVYFISEVLCNFSWWQKHSLPLDNAHFLIWYFSNSIFLKHQKILHNLFAFFILNIFEAVDLLCNKSYCMFMYFCNNFAFLGCLKMF